MGAVGARSVVAFAWLALCPVLASAQRPFVERVDVSRVLIDARVLDDRGHAVLDLGPEDFTVDIDGDAVRVESVEWIEGGERDVEDVLADPDDEGARTTPLARRRAASSSCSCKKTSSPRGSPGSWSCSKSSSRCCSRFAPPTASRSSLRFTSPNMD